MKPSSTTSPAGTGSNPLHRGRRRRSSLGPAVVDAPPKHEQQRQRTKPNNELAKNDSMAKLVEMLHQSGMDLSFLPELPKTYERLRKRPACADESSEHASRIQPSQVGKESQQSSTAWLEQEVSRLRAQVQIMEEERTNLLNDMQAENRALLQVLHAAHESREQMNRDLSAFLSQRDELMAQHSEHMASSFDRELEDTPLAQELLQPVPREGARELQALVMRLSTRIRACHRDVLIKVLEEARAAGDLFLSGQDLVARLQALQDLTNLSAAALLPPASPHRTARSPPSPKGSSNGLAGSTPRLNERSSTTKNLSTLAHSQFLATQTGLGHTTLFPFTVNRDDQEGLALVLRAERAEAEVRTLREANVLLEAHLTRLRHTAGDHLDPHRTLRSSGLADKTKLDSGAAPTATIVEEGEEASGQRTQSVTDPPGEQQHQQQQEAAEEEAGEGDPLARLPTAWRDTAERMVRAYLRKLVDMGPLAERLKGEGQAQEHARAAVVEALVGEVVPGYVELLLLFVGSDYVAKATARQQQPHERDSKAVMRDVCGQVLASPALDSEVTALLAMYMRYLHDREPALLTARQADAEREALGQGRPSSPKR